MIAVAVDGSPVIRTSTRPASAADLPQRPIDLRNRIAIEAERSSRRATTPTTVSHTFWPLSNEISEPIGSRPSHCRTIDSLIIATCGAFS